MGDDLLPVVVSEDDALDEPDGPTLGHRASAARVHNYLLGGRDNYSIDRDAAAGVCRLAPCLPEAAAASRLFVTAAVAELAATGLQQFLDIGCGLPLGAGVHDIAQGINPDARVAYVDNDPIVLTHARALLATNANTRAVYGDARLPKTIVGNEEVQAHLDWHQPVAVLATAMLHHLDDAQADLLIGTLRAVMAPGSVLVLTHLTADFNLLSGDLHQAVGRYTRLVGPAHLRSRVDLGAMLLDLELRDPGLVQVHRWPRLGQALPKALPVLAGIAQIPHRAATPRAGQP